MASILKALICPSSKWAFFIMVNTVTISLDLYNSLRDASEKLAAVNRGAFAFIEISETSTHFGNFVRMGVNILNKDETILVLKDQIKDLQCRLDEEKDKLVKFRIEQESKKKKWWFWPR